MRAGAHAVRVHRDDNVGRWYVVHVQRDRAANHLVSIVDDGLRDPPPNDLVLQIPQGANQGLTQVRVGADAGPLTSTMIGASARVGSDVARALCTGDGGGAGASFAHEVPATRKRTGMNLMVPQWQIGALLGYG